MKGDAELLLNFARPNIPHTTAHSARTSVDESFPYSEKEPARHAGAEYGGSYMGMDRKPAYDASAYSSFASSRLRSQSDGSTVTSRPVIHGVRPSTSSFTLPPIAGHYEAKPIGSDSAPSANQPQHVDSPLYSTIGRSSKVEDAADSDDSNQTSCAACNLARISTNADGDDEVTWISCDGCKQWFHIACAGFKNDREIRTVDRFICRGCRPVHGPTTFVRKSSRARTAIDYAGLHQGLVKSSSDSLEHHYIEPIRQGKIQFLPENFPRMHPDLVSAEYFERGIGMTEPIVIPAHLNRRESDIDALAQEAPTQEMFDELLDHLPEDDQPFEETVDCGQDQLDMVIPEGLTVKTVADLYGPDERVEVIDVKSQQGEDKRWTMQKWADYYESTEEKVVRNVISLEISHSKLGRLIRRPKIVRDLDLQDEVWPDELKAVGDFPNVQLYCLMSVADCYTDFHIDFGGSSVFYTILKGSKTFFFIPPKEKHLKKYEEWCNSPAQDNTFLGDQTKECYRVDLREGDTMMIPSGWIHAVWTPKNSLVIGGNFLTRLNYGMQIKIAKIEKDTKVPRKFRYPFFQKVQWYAALKYLEDDPIPQSVLDAFAQDENYCFPREYPVYYEFGEKTNTSPPGSPYHNARFYSQAELEGLHELARYLLRTALIAGSYLVEGVTMEVRNAIKRSIPKGVGDPVDTIRMFGVWVAWKRGNEQAASFTRPGVIESNPKVTVDDKKPAGRPSRRSERNAGSHTMYAERQAVQRPVDQPADLPNNQASGTSVPSDTGTPAQVAPSMMQEGLKPRTVPRGSGLGPKRVACDGCRKRRIRCRHKDEQGDAIPTDQMAFGPAVQGPLTHEGASALDSLAAVASKAGFQDGAYTPGLDRLDSAGKLYAAMDTPFAASARPDVSPDGINSGKKGRSKACDECRKSKVCSIFLRQSLLCRSLICFSAVAYTTSMVESILSRLKSDRSPEVQTRRSVVG
jgi:F-box/leucine-rich repeat protein 10/11